MKDLWRFFATLRMTDRGDAIERGQLRFKTLGRSSGHGVPSVVEGRARPSSDESRRGGAGRRF